MSDNENPTLEQQEVIPNGVDTGAPETPAPDNEPPVRRRRGRPPKNPDAAPARETPTSTGAKRGPKPKSDKKVYTSAEIDIMGKQLVGLHIMIAQISGMPEMSISEQEAGLMAQSIVNVADQYDLAIDGKTGAALQLAMTVAMIYGPRALAIRARKMQQQKNEMVVNG